MLKKPLMLLIFALLFGQFAAPVPAMAHSIIGEIANDDCAQNQDCCDEDCNQLCAISITSYVLGDETGATKPIYAQQRHGKGDANILLAHIAALDPPPPRNVSLGA